MAVTESKKIVTGDELLVMGDIGRCELVQGEIVFMSPSGGRHGELTIAIGALLRIHVKTKQIGKTYGAETGFYTRRNPDTVRAPDAMFISSDRVAKITDHVKFLDVAPNLVVEVLSPGDTWTEVETKVQEYFTAGVRLIWIIDPKAETITVYRSANERTILTRTDILTGGDILPEFSVPVSEIFE